jgi:hypothetical protein
VFDFGDLSPLIPLVADAAVGAARHHVAPLPAMERQALVAGQRAWARSAAGVLYAGWTLAGVQFPYGELPTLIGIGLLWALLFPVLHAMARRLSH